MADNTIDTLDIQISSSTAKAVRSLENLSRKLVSVNQALNNVNTGGLRNYARDIGRVSASIKALNGVKVSIPNLSGLSRQLTSISSVNFSALDGSGKSLKDFASGLLSISGLQNISVPKIDTKNINSVTKAIEKLGKVDSSNAQQTINSIQKVAHSMSVLNTVDFSGSKVIQGINAVKRLMEVKTDNFDTTTLDKIANSMKSFSDLPDVSSSTNRFVSSLQKLVNAGDKARQVEAALPGLGKQLKSVIKTLSRVGDVSEPTNLFVQSIGRLASAGNKTSQTAGQLQNLAQETNKFFKVMENAPKISENTIRMTEALAQLASAGGKVNSATNSISKAFSKLSSSTLSLGNLVSKTASKIGSGIKAIIGWFQRLGSDSSGLKTASFNLSALFKTAIGFKAIQGLVDFGRSAVDLGSQITEVENVVDVAFGSMSDKAYQFASTAKEQFGLSELAAKTYSGTMMAMLKSSGVAQNAASDMSITLAGLAGDMASFFNLDTDVAFQKIRAGISGEIEPLRQLGINLSVANMEAYALSKGITTSYNAMSQAEKVALRYNYLMSVTGEVQGDFARTSGTWANQVRLLTLNFQSLSAVIGQGLIAGILPAIQALNALMSKLMQAANAFRNFMYVLMGKKLKGSQSGVSDIVSNLGGIETAGDDASSGLDDATSSAKKLKKALSVLPFDQLNQLADNSDNSGTASKSLGSGLGDLADSFAGIQDSLDEVLTVDETPINKWASKIRKAFLDKDWEGVGTTIADMLNLGMKKVYDVISWEKVGPKVTSFITAFTETFNSLVDHIDWYLMGKTVGTGINTVVKALNLAITKIDWEKLGKKFAKGIKGLVKEVNWKELGELLGNKFMVPWKIFSGFVRDLPYADIGKTFANTLNGVFSRISFSEIGNSLATALNGAFTSLYNFAIHFNWTRLVNNIASGINTFIGKFDWKGNGQKLETFLDKLCTSIVDFARKTDWEEVGRGIGEFLGQVKWGEHFIQVGSAILKALKDMFNGLETSGTAGKIASFLGKAFLAVKIADVFGIGNLVSSLVKTIGKKVIGSDMIASLSGKLTSLLGDAVSGAAGSFTDLATAISPLVGTAGLIVAVGAAAAGATSELAKFVETMQGGNGIGTTFGNTMNNFIQTLQGRGDLISSSAEEIWQLKESLEKEGMTAEDKATATQTLIDKLSSMGVTSTQARQAFSALHQQGLITDDMFNILAESIKTMSNNTSNMAGSVDLGNKKIKDGSPLYNKMKVAIGNVTNQLHQGSDAQTSMNNALDNVMDSGGTAQEAFKAIMSTAQALGLNTESVAKIFAETFPESVKVTESTAKNSFSGMATSATTNMGTVSTAVANASSSVSSKTKTGFGLANTAVSTAMAGMKKSTENTMPSIWSKIKNTNDDVKTNSKTNWGNSASAVSTALGTMDTDTKTIMGRVMSTIQSYWSSVLINTSQIWEKASGKVDTETGKMKTYIETNLSGISSKIESLFKIDLKSAGQNTAQSFADGMKLVTLPTLTYRISEWRKHNLGNGKTSSTPVYSPNWYYPNWYAKGGLFNGAQVIGIGEAGSEAVLPLENPRTMKKIADSIVSSSDGSMGLTKEEMAKAVAQGVAMAMSMNSGNKNPQYIMNSIILDGNEIAKAVTKAQNDTDSRFNPSPAY